MTKSKIYCLLVLLAANFAYAFTDVETVQIELSVKNCNYNAICEPLLGETVEGCDLDCEPPAPPEPPAEEDSNYNGRSGNRILTGSYASSLDPMWQSYQPWINTVTLYLKDINSETFTIGWNFTNLQFDYFKLVKSPFRYPLNDTDGLVVYEGPISEVKNESLKNLYYYGIFQRIADSIFVPRIYFTTPDAPNIYPFLTSNIPSQITPDDFPQQSNNLNVGEIGLFQNDEALPIEANVAKVDDSPITVLVDTGASFSDEYNLVGSISSVLSDDRTIYQFQDAVTGQILQIPALKTPGDYVLRVTVTSRDGKRSGVSNILIHYDPKNLILGPENYCKQTLITAKYLCFVAVGNQLHFLAEKIIKIW